LEPVYWAFQDDDRYQLSVLVGKDKKRVGHILLLSQRKRIENTLRVRGYSVTDQTEGFDGVFCGAQVKNPERFGDAKLFNLDHGPGIKTLRYRHLLRQKSTKYYCFVEGQYRIDKFKKYGLDKIHDVYDTGLPKLDQFFDGYYDRQQLHMEFGLDSDKKTVLYAPSYKPTSIFLVGDKLRTLCDDYNVIVKLHPYSWSGKYASRSHHRLFETLVREEPRIHLAGPNAYDIRPYMFVADTMISDGSSVINEFLALERCGIIIDLPDEKHHDGTSLLEEQNAEWLRDSFIHIAPDDDLKQAVDAAIEPSAQRMRAIIRDKQFIFSYTDGQSAQRVKQIVERILFT
jgi:CDP-glycerol glycerophosphotransferase (TagB/SpsB family)